ncbi:MAG: hypothetical protein ISP90_01565 [Nevskia sp.]|nr:hypothetical protein [Nevskia sp.]
MNFRSSAGNACGVLLALLAGCVTPESRVKDNPASFAGLPPAQQELVRKGQIALGMPEVAVKIALGEPDRITEHTDAQGVQHVWHYTESVATAPAITYPYVYGPWGFGSWGPMFDTYPSYVERDRMRVIFVDGRVSAIEREMNRY